MKLRTIIVFALAFAASLPAQELSLRIAPFEDSRYEGRITATFSNDSKQVIKLLRPLDGSEWRWHKPYYDFSVFNSKGEQMKLALRCGLSGLYSNLKWPDDYLLVLEPGTKKSVDLDLPFEIPSEGDYQVTLSYIYDSTPDKKILNADYPEDLWKGITKSNLITIPLKQK